MPGQVYYFSGKASLQEVTNPNAQPIGIDGGCTFQMTTVNKGTTYQSVSYPYGGIQLEVQSKTGSVWIAGGWNGTQPTIKQQTDQTGGVSGQ